ncbi:hypothetical protein Pcinc_012624 [Petrolisthes cinctipes]|uniref:Uncharacterized protein n=1 Tax=Petrolisthes cinctipes TaxID=88211 RepID=A0AAE1FYN4_PETCI|nr:hypothetical protein Pcinc_012624 [Petrolisthes cinctipes]
MDVVLLRQPPSPPPNNLAESDVDWMSEVGLSFPRGPTNTILKFHHVPPTHPPHFPSRFNYLSFLTNSATANHPPQAGRQSTTSLITLP